MIQKAALHPVDSLKTRMQYSARKGGGGRTLLISDLSDAYKIVKVAFSLLSKPPVVSTLTDARFRAHSQG